MRPGNPVIRDQRQILLDEQEARSLPDHRNIYSSVFTWHG